MWMLFWAAASRVWKIIRLRAERPVDGELATTMAALSPRSSHQRKYSMSASTSPEVSSQFSAKVGLQVAHGRALRRGTWCRASGASGCRFPWS